MGRVVRVVRFSGGARVGEWWARACGGNCGV